MACGVLPHPREYRGQLPPLAAVKSIGRVAVLTAQRTARESHEYGRDAGSVGLSLERMEDLGDPEARHAALRVRLTPRAARLRLLRGLRGDAAQPLGGEFRRIGSRVLLCDLIERRARRRVLLLL